MTLRTSVATALSIPESYVTVTASGAQCAGATRRRLGATAGFSWIVTVLSSSPAAAAANFNALTSVAASALAPVTAALVATAAATQLGDISVEIAASPPVAVCGDGGSSCGTLPGAQGGGGGGSDSANKLGVGAIAGIAVAAAAIGAAAVVGAFIAYRRLRHPARTSARSAPPMHDAAEPLAHEVAPPPQVKAPPPAQHKAPPPEQHKAPPPAQRKAPPLHEEDMSVLTAPAANARSRVMLPPSHTTSEGVSHAAPPLRRGPEDSPHVVPRMPRAASTRHTAVPPPASEPGNPNESRTHVTGLATATYSSAAMSAFLQRAAARRAFASSAATVRR
jgi:hypothetical protein